MKYRVVEIPHYLTYDWLLRKHYAHRIPSITFSFGVYDMSDILQGVCTFGTPASSGLRQGVCGIKNIDIVIELNRLVLNDGLPINTASYFVSRCLRFLPTPSIVVSFADPSHGHTGYIYQACNFIYTGLSAKRTDWKLRGLENLHSVTIADMTRGLSNRAEIMRQKYGDDFYLEARAQKHRYVFFVGNKTQKTELMKDLLYKQQPYPKGDNTKYNASYNPPNQSVMF